MSDANSVSDLSGLVGSERSEGRLSIQVMPVDGAEGVVVYIDHQDGHQLLVAEIYLTPWQASKLAKLLGDTR